MMITCLMSCRDLVNCGGRFLKWKFYCVEIFQMQDWKTEIKQLLFISHTNKSNLVLAQNISRLDELESIWFIFHRNGPWGKKSKRKEKKQGPCICIYLWLDRAQNEFTVSLIDVAGLMSMEWSSSGWGNPQCVRSFIPSAHETEVSLIMLVSQGHSLIF